MTGVRVGIWAAALALLFGAAAPVLAQKPGGTLHLFDRDSPASASLHEEATVSAGAPFMAVYNNLVLFDQQQKQNRLDNIQPELADSWEWNPDKTKLTFHLHKGVKWHDGQPFTAKDVKCTWDMVMGKTQGLRLNPRKILYRNVAEITADDDYTATFHLKRPQPAFLMLLATGQSPVYPCHVPPAQMRTKPIGTGPFKFVEFKANEVIRLTKNTDYWKPGKPYLDAVEWTVIPNRSTQTLAFVSGKLDMTFPYEVTPALVRDIKAQAPDAICEIDPMPVAINLLVNRDKPPFDNSDIRRAMLLALDRKAFLDILVEGQGSIGGALLPPPGGVWGLPPEMLQTLPGYGPDVEKSRAEARKLMEKAGYGPDKHLNVKVSTRNIAQYRDPAVILIDQLKHIYIDGELDTVETANWYPKIARKDYMVGGNLSGSGADDPDAYFYEHYACGSERNYTNYCNPELEKQFDQQSMEADPEKRAKLVWEIDKKLQEDGARPIIFHYHGGTCRWPRVHGITVMTNSIFNGWRFDDAWLE